MLPLGNMENFKIGYKLLCFMVRHIYMEIFTRNALTRSMFELENVPIFEWVRISPEIDWC